MSNVPASLPSDPLASPATLVTLEEVAALHAELAALREGVAHLAERTTLLEQRVERHAEVIELLDDRTAEGW